MTVGSSLRTIWEDLLEGAAQPASLPAGDFIFGAGDVPTIALVRAGIVRVFIVVHASDAIHPNHQFTIRYARSGDLIGLAPYLAGSRGWNAQAVVHTTLVVVTIEQVRAAAQRHLDLPWSIAEHIATWASEAIEAIAQSHSQPTGASIAHHLHEMALTTPDGHLVAAISQQLLADAAGTAREVVSRELGLLRAQGVIATKLRRIEILDEERLQRIATGDASTVATDAPPPRSSPAL